MPGGFVSELLLPGDSARSTARSAQGHPSRAWGTRSTVREVRGVPEGWVGGGPCCAVRVSCARRNAALTLFWCVSTCGPGLGRACWGWGWRSARPDHPDKVPLSGVLPRVVKIAILFLTAIAPVERFAPAAFSVLFSSA